jgi:oxygen-dependent protoporphyrinogen oxidase
MITTAVIGGGPAGCAAAYTLGKNGYPVHLFEAEDHVGGRTSQLRVNGFNLNTGALFLMGGIYPRTNAIIKELGRRKELFKWNAKTEVIDTDGARYGATFDQVMSFVKMPVFSVRDRIRIAAGVAAQLVSRGPKTCFDGADLAKFDRGETLQSWSTRVLGEKATRYITVPYMGFLYAVPMNWLSTPLFKAIVQQFYKLKLAVPPEGMGQINDWMIAGTPHLDLHLCAPVAAIEPNGAGYRIRAGEKAYDVDAVILAPEPGVSAELLDGLAPASVVDKLRACRYTDYAHAQVCYTTNPWPNTETSVVLPANPNSIWGAAVLQSHRHPGAVPEGGQAVGVYYYTPPLVDMTDDDIEKSAIRAAEEAYGPAPEPSFVRVFHYRRGLSIAGPGHYATMNSLHIELPDGIYLAGDYFAHAGVEAAVLTGERAANQAIRADRGSGPSRISAVVSACRRAIGAILGADTQHQEPHATPNAGAIPPRRGDA